MTLADPERPRYAARKGIRITRIDPPHHSDFLTWTLLYNHMMANTAILLHKKQNFDLIHAHDWMTFLAGSILKHALGIPMVATFHSTERGRRGGIPTPFEKMINDIEWLGSYEANHVITVGHSIKDELVNNLTVPADKISVIHNGMKLRRKTLEHPEIRNAFASPEERILLFVGRLVWQKGVKYFIEAAPSILREHPEAKLVIVGEGNMCQDLRKLASNLGISQKVYLTGRVSDNILNSLYGLADILVVPSIYEPFGLSALEGMASGVPVVASEVGGLSDIITDGKDGILIPPGNSRRISTVVNDLLSNSSFAESLSRNGKARARYFGAQRMAEETSRVYGMVLGLHENTKKVNEERRSSTALAPWYQIRTR